MNMRLQGRSLRVLGVVIIGLLCCEVGAAENYTIFTVTTAQGATSQGNPVAAQAVFEVSSNSIHVILTNLLNNPTSVSQALSSLFFQVDNGTTTATLSSSSAMNRDIHSNGTYQDLGVSATGWKELTSGNRMELCDIGCGAAGPSNTLIGGPGANGKYTSNSSITGNGPHNPFLVGNAVFDLAVTGVTYQSVIRNVTFGFGTTAGFNVDGSVYTSVVVPEPSAILLLATCIGVLALAFRCKWVIHLSRR
jgi:hypothetical protein